MYSRMSFIYKYETSTLTPFVKPYNILNSDVQECTLWTIVRGICFYVQSGVDQVYISRMNILETERV